MRRAAVDMESPQTRTAISSCLSCASSRSSMDRKTCVRAESLIRTDVSHKLQNYKNGQYMSMQHIFRKHVKPKKQHEIDQLSKVRVCHVFLLIVSDDPSSARVRSCGLVCPG